jgi:hypothetical protein
MKRIVLSLLLVVGFAIPIAPPTFAADLNDCRVPHTKWSALSLGFPVKIERLKYISNPKILVIPFHAKDEPELVLSSTDKGIFSQSQKDIQSLSSNMSNIEFVFHRTIKLNIDTSEMDNLKINAQKTFHTDFENDQFGFAHNLIRQLDAEINYTGIDAIVLYGFSKQAKQEIASALQYTRDPDFVGNKTKRPDGTNWYEPIITKEKDISNVILMYNNVGSPTLTHELLHNYGLTDLYGSNKGPGSLSLMATNEIRLLSYEKWLLGWHPDQYVTCISGNDSQKLNKFELDIREQEQIALVRPNQDSLYVIETSRVKENYVLSFYKLINDDRPPITFYSYSDGRAGVKLGDYKYPNFAFSHQGDQHSLLIHSITDSVVTVYTYPNSAASSPEVQRLLIEARMIQEAKVKETADLRTKQEAEAAAELKAKQEVEARVAADKLAADKLAAAKLASMKKTTITCVKGKVTKKVTAVKPKCPTGYKVKK